VRGGDEEQPAEDVPDGTMIRAVTVPEAASMYDSRVTRAPARFSARADDHERATCPHTGSSASSAAAIGLPRRARRSLPGSALRS
jgi:hypothetical protein